MCVCQSSCAHACYAMLMGHLASTCQETTPVSTDTHVQLVLSWAKNGYRSGKSMQYRVTTPKSQAGRRYAFQFHGSSEADWKQRRKESSTMAEAASVNKLLMSSKSALQVTLFCNTMALDKNTIGLGDYRGEAYKRSRL